MAPETEKDSFLRKSEDTIVSHIFSASAAMVGVTFTVIGILNVSAAFKKIQTLSDDLTAVDAIAFLAACFLSYSAMKTSDQKLRLTLEKWADFFFMAGLGLMVVVCIFIVKWFS